MKFSILSLGLGFYRMWEGKGDLINVNSRKTNETGKDQEQKPKGEN